MFLVTTHTEANSLVIKLKGTQTNTYANIFRFGAILNAYGFEGDKKINCIDGYPNCEAAIAEMNTWFKSCLLSPFVCRLHKGAFSFDGKQYNINKFYLGKHAIHGLIYDYEYALVKKQEGETFCSVVLQADYKSEDDGFPFNYAVQHTYKLDKNGLTVFTTITNKSNIIMPYAQGWHPYFTISETVNDCSLQLASSKQIEFDAELIPTKKIIANSSFLELTSIQNKNLDDCFILENDRKAILQNSDYSFTVTALKGYDFLQVFTPDHRKNIALEVLSAAPDCFNNGMGLLQIAPNESVEFGVNYSLKEL